MNTSSLLSNWRLFWLAVMMLGLMAWVAPAARAQTCAAPTNVAVTTPTASSAVVSFTPNAVATSYTVRYYYAYDSLGTTAQTVVATSSPVTLTGLQYSTYYVTVTSNCTATGGPTSAPVRFQFAWASCGTPATVRATATGSTTASVTYAAVSGASSYTVKLLIPGTTVVAASTTTTSTTASFTGLTPSTVYIVSVVANCAGGITSGAIGTSVTTAGSTGCASVTNLNVTATSSTTALVSFTGVTGGATYSVRYYAVGDSLNSHTIMPAVAPIVLSGLLPNTNYVVLVTAYCTATSASSPVIRVVHTPVAPAPCGTVSSIVVTASTATTATVSFTPGQNNTSFHITYGVANDSARWVNSTSSPVTLTGLVPGQTYNIQVTSLCGTGGSVTYTGATPVAFSFRPSGSLGTSGALGTGVLSVFPNPAHHSARLLLPAVLGAAQAQLFLINAVGQQVRIAKIPLLPAGTQAQLDLTGVAPGLYTLRVAVGGQTASQRLVVE